MPSSIATLEAPARQAEEAEVEAAREAQAEVVVVDEVKITRVKS